MIFYSSEEKAMQGVFEKKDYFALNGRYIRGLRAYPPMFHTHGELVYVVRGEIAVTVEGKPYRIGAGEIFALFPYLVHSYAAAPEAEVLLLMFDPASTAFQNTLLNKKPVCPRVRAETLYPLLERAVFWSRSGRIKTALGYLNAVLGEILELSELEPAERNTENTTVRILEYCAEHFSEPISISSLAEALFISPSRVSGIFSEKIRCGFCEYIQSLRIQKAKTLLLMPDRRIVEIMLDCGFQNQSSFNRVFRRFCGTTPRAYRRSGKGQSEE